MYFQHEGHRSYNLLQKEGFYMHIILILLLTVQELPKFFLSLYSKMISHHYLNPEAKIDHSFRTKKHRILLTVQAKCYNLLRCCDCLEVDTIDSLDLNSSLANNTEVSSSSEGKYSWSMRRPFNTSEGCRLFDAILPNWSLHNQI